MGGGGQNITSVNASLGKFKSLAPWEARSSAPEPIALARPNLWNHHLY